MQAARLWDAHIFFLNILIWFLSFERGAHETFRLPWTNSFHPQWWKETACHLGDNFAKQITLNRLNGANFFFAWQEDKYNFFSFFVFVFFFCCCCFFFIIGTKTTLYDKKRAFKLLNVINRKQFFRKKYRRIWYVNLSLSPWHFTRYSFYIKIGNKPLWMFFAVSCFANYLIYNGRDFIMHSHVESIFFLL